MNLITKKETMISAYSHHGFLSEKGKKEKNYNGFLYITMLVAGLEPARTNVRQILSLLRMPIPPYQQIAQFLCFLTAPVTALASAIPNQNT